MNVVTRVTVWNVAVVAALLTAFSASSARGQTGSGELGGLPRKGGLPLERLDGVEIRYDAVRSGEGSRLRTIVTRPAGASGRRPALFVVGWLSCDSVESPPRAEATDGIGLTLQAIAARSKLVTFRVDKPGVGDSEGVCEETDFTTELSGYRAAFRAFSRHEWVDPSRILVLGLSNGGGFAPLVTNGFPVRAYVTSGGWSKSWLEHMLEHERRRLVLSGLSDGVASERMRGYATFYDRYLNGGQAPGAVLRELPHLTPLWYDAPEHQYGRPARFYQQLQSLNLMAAWESVRVPVLAIWGQFDWIMSRGDLELIVEVVNRSAPNRARLVEVPRMGHSHQVFDSLQDAFTFRNPQFDAHVVETILAFLKEVA